VEVTAAPGPDRGQITIRWRPNAPGEGVVAYEIWRTGQSGNTFSLVGTSTSDTFTDSVAKRRRPWRYYIIAKDDTGLVSAPSAEVRARPR
jgi:hypothetical protein